MSRKTQTIPDSPGGEVNQAFCMLFRNHPFPMWIYDPETLAILETNNAADQVYGYTQGEFGEMTLADLYPPQEASILLENVKHHHPASNHSGEWRHRLKNGAIIDVEISGSTVEYNRQPAAFLMAQNISARKQTEETLQITLAKYKTLFESFPLGITVSDEVGNVIESNASSEILLGISTDEQTRRSIDGPDWQIIRPNGTPMPSEEFASVKALKEKRLVKNVEMGIVKPDSTVTWINVTAAPLALEGHGVVVTYGDITERKQMERECNLLTDAITASLDEIYLFDADTLRFIYVNTGALKNLQYTLDQALQMTPLDIKPEFNSESFEELLKPLRTGEKADQILETTHRRADGTIYPVEAHLQLFQKERVFLAVIIDITERKRTEDALLKNARELARSQRIGKLGNWDWDVAGNTLTWSDEIYCIWGVDKDFPLTYENIESMIHPEDREPNRRMVQEFLAGRDEGAYEFRIICLDGSEKHLHQNIEVTRDTAGKPTHIFGIMQDISASKQAEQALKKSEEMFRITLENILDPLFITDKAGGFTFICPNVSRTLHYSVKDIQAMGSIHSLIGNNEWAGNVLEQDGELENIEINIFDKEGTPHAFLVNSKRVCIGEGRHLFSLREITERKQAEQALRDSEERFRTLLDKVSNIAVQGYTADGTVHFWNKASEQIYGYTSEEALGKNLVDLIIPPEIKPAVTEAIHTMIASGESRPAEEVSLMRKDGSQVAVFSNHTIVDIKGRGRELYCIDLDLTELKQTQQALQESEEKLRSIFRVAPTGIGIVKDRVILEVNPCICEMTGYSREELVGQSARLLYPTQEDFEFVGAEKYRQIAQHGSGAVETRWQHKNGAILFILLASTPVDPADLLKGVIFTALDITNRKKAEGALKESEARNRAILNAMPDMVFVNDHEGIFLDYHAADPNILYLPPEQFLGRKIIEIFPPEFANPFTTLIEQAHTTGALQSFEYQMKIAGEARVFELRATPYSGKNTLTIVREITERKQAEQALILSELRFRTFVEKAGDIVYALTPEGIFTYVSPNWTEILGHDVDEVVSQSFGKFIHPEDLPRTRQFLAQVLSTGKQRTGVEYRVRHKDGSWRWHSSNASRIIDVDGKATSFLGIARDITERKQAEEEIMALNDRLRHLINAIKELSSANTLDRIQRIVSSSAKALAGADGATMVLRDGDQCFYADEESIAPLWKGARFPMNICISGWVMLNRTPAIIEDIYADPRIPLDVYRTTFVKSLAILPVNREEPVAAIGIYWGTIHTPSEIEIQLIQTLADISTSAIENVRLLSELEQRVEERTRELFHAQEKLVRQERLAVLGQLAGGVGHELRNPLGVINNAIYFLRLIQPQAESKVKEYLGIIETETRNADKIITDLLDFSRIKSVEQEPVHVGDLITRTLERFPAPEKIQVTINLPRNLPAVFVDVRQVIQVLGNLTVNACQAMRGAGNLIFEAHKETIEKRGFIAIAVKDTGGGISSENMEKLFEPLFTTKLKGIGLGLAVSKKLVEANDGHIAVSNQAGKGATFIVYLPVFKEK